MRSYFLIIVLLVALACASHHPVKADNLHADIAGEVQARFDSLATAARTGDSDAYYSHFDKQHFSGIHMDGKVWPDFTSFKIAADYGFVSVKKTHSLIFSDVHVQVIDDRTVILINRFEQDIELHDGIRATVKGAGTQVWSRRSGTWLLVSVSASRG